MSYSYTLKRILDRHEKLYPEKNAYVGSYVLEDYSETLCTIKVSKTNLTFTINYTTEVKVSLAAGEVEEYIQHANRTCNTGFFKIERGHQGLYCSFVQVIWIDRVPTRAALEELMHLGSAEITGLLYKLHLKSEKRGG